LPSSINGADRILDSIECSTGVPTANLTPDIAAMQPGQIWSSDHSSSSLNGARYRRVIARRKPRFDLVVAIRIRDRDPTRPGRSANAWIRNFGMDACRSNIETSD